MKNGINRKEFIRGALATAAVGMSGCAGAKAVGVTPTADVKIRSALLHLGMNMWRGYRAPDEKIDPKLGYARTECPTEPAVWDAVVRRMHERHYNMAIIDLGGGVEFPSHPEITVKGSRSAQWMRDEVRRLADMGIEAVPKLNFAATHDAWLGIYERMLSTPKYYEVVKDIIADAVEMFGNPRFIHIGMDEEDATWQKNYPMVVVRRGELWWHDFNFYQKCIESHNARTIAFCSSMIDYDADALARRIPKSTVLNPALYGHDRTLEWAKNGLKKHGDDHWWRDQVWLLGGILRQLSERGFDILSCSSNWVDVSNKKKYPVVKYGKDYPQDRQSIAWFHDLLAKEVAPERLIGGMTAPWTAMEEKFLPYWLDGIDLLADAMDAHGWRS